MPTAVMIDRIDRRQVLIYLSCKDEKLITEGTEDMMNECEQLLLDVMSPKYIYKYFPIIFSENAVIPEGTNLVLEGRSICEHLTGCSGIFLIAATIGPEADRLIRRFQIEDMAKAVIIDAFASTAAEQICGIAEEQIRNICPEKYFTWRYAPGYGDLPVNIQKNFLDVLDAPRKIGLCCSDSSILTPIKSITSVMGVSDFPLPKRARGCVTCNMKDVCSFRKRGQHCEF